MIMKVKYLKYCMLLHLTSLIAGTLSRPGLHTTMYGGNTLVGVTELYLSRLYLMTVVPGQTFLAVL